ncbi:MAG: hypothetical protein GTO45_19725 [Candidatus Aminicenantes bacterium]|nr:hypothetical protein [Candidatus Aminicenantes bacterium]NIM81021.1 hypothetical protein [Candidatus Aminicenantes bacterium]NIN20400.1 hypothetical protein [Candidatus Aminicenantes bacterium]NIN44173.1 hypothetical protein [Candidatus Aminicenantes bacterium]NIN86991.1 hypothetical protein [Candidatus Aminicenantes bacterium]
MFTVLIIIGAFILALFFSNYIGNICFDIDEKDGYDFKKWQKVNFILWLIFCVSFIITLLILFQMDASKKLVCTVLLPLGLIWDIVGAFIVVKGYRGIGFLVLWRGFLIMFFAAIIPLIM